MPPEIEVRIANIPVRVPVYRDEATTRALAEELNARIQQLEQKARKIDTQAYALRVAYELLTAVVEQRAAAALEESALASSLERIAERLETIATVAAQGGQPRAEGPRGGPGLTLE